MVLTSVFWVLGLAPSWPDGLVRWHPTVEEARAAAAREGKLVFVYYLVGDLDREKC